MSEKREKKIREIIKSLKNSGPLYKKLCAIVANILFRSNHFKDDRESLQSTTEDIIQDTIIAALTELKKGELINNLEAWCTTVSKNKTIDFLKKKKNSRLPEFDDLESSDKGTKNFNKIEKIFEDKVHKENSYISMTQPD